MVVHQLIRGKPFTLLDLWNHFVGAAGHTEIVDIAAAEHGSHRRADILHSQSHLGQLVAVHLQHGLRLVDFEVGIHVHEQSAGMRLFQKGLRNFIESGKGIGRADDKLHRKPLARAGQRRRLKNHRICAGDLTDSFLHLRLQCPGRTGSFIPRLEHKAGKS